MGAERFFNVSSGSKFLNHGFLGWAQMGLKPELERLISVLIRGIRGLKKPFFRYQSVVPSPILEELSFHYIYALKPPGDHTDRKRDQSPKTLHRALENGNDRDGSYRKHKSEWDPGPAGNRDRGVLQA